MQPGGGLSVECDGMKRPNKYHAKKAHRCGVCGAEPMACKCHRDVAELLIFDSQAEARRWDQLRQAVGRRAGAVAEGSIERQVAYPLYARMKNGELGFVGKYVADFRWRPIGKPNELVVEDVKGFDTPLAKWKRKHCELQYGIKIEIIKA